MNNLGTAKIVGLIAASGVMLSVGGLLSDAVKPALADPGGLTGKQQERLEQVASASLFGQFRTSLSDYLWLKADKYLHRGVDLRGLTPEEKAAMNTDKVQSRAGEEGERAHRGDETTIIPSKVRDWRGHLGDIERTVSPYMDMSNHGHADTREALPLFRMMTWSNPHFIRGYIVGAGLIIADKNRIDEGIAFLKEGEANNPQSFEIKTEIGHFYTFKKRAYDTGFPYLTQAIALAAERDPQTLNEDEKDARRDAYRWAVLNRREAGDKPTAKKYATDCAALYPDDVVCTGYLVGGRE